MANLPAQRTARCVLSAAVLFSTVGCAVVPESDRSEDYFRLVLQPGERYANVFSKAVARKGEGFESAVERWSGSSVGEVVSADPARPVFRGSGIYDGSRSFAGTQERREGGRVDCWDGKCVTDNQTSSTTFNPLLWGEPPRELRPGTAWTINIPDAWECGPPGTETVRVVSMDPVNHVVMLERNGSGFGVAVDDARPVKITVDGMAVEATVAPALSRWIGQTIIRRGVIISDEIMVERHVLLQSAAGNFEADERDYTLMNQSPVEPAPPRETPVPR